MPLSVTQEIAGVLAEPDIDRKLSAGRQLIERLQSGPRGLARDEAPLSTETPPARPASWTVVDPMTVPERPNLKSSRGRFLLMHSVAHIELSAVELALMSVADFADLPVDYYRDMLRIASEEIEHARMLQNRLHQLGGELGEEPVHLGLWKTASEFPDLVQRMAVVPRILEAKGLDVSARLRDQLTGAGDADSARVLDVVYQDEIGHVSVGTVWFRWACERRGLDSEQAFIDLVGRFQSKRSVRLDPVGRRQAGFTEREMAAVRGYS